MYRSLMHALQYLLHLGVFRVQRAQVNGPADAEVDDLDVPLLDLGLLEHHVSLMQAAVRDSDLVQVRRRQNDLRVQLKK